MNARAYAFCRTASWVRTLMRAALITALFFSLSPQPLPGSAMPTRTSQVSGGDLVGWEVVLGDAAFVAPGEAPVTTTDIATTHLGAYSELRANVDARKIMAHNITFIRFYDSTVLSYPQAGTYQFNLPYQPSTSNVGLNGETIEGHLSVWDGASTRREYLVAFQWVINPWSPQYGDLNAWDPTGTWKKVGQLDPSTAWGGWHTVEMRLDIARTSAHLRINEQDYPAAMAILSHPDWGNEVAVRLAAEVISLYPGEGNGALHKAYIRNWAWISINQKSYLPLMMTAQ